MSPVASRTSAKGLIFTMILQSSILHGNLSFCFSLGVFSPFFYDEAFMIVSLRVVISI